MLYKDKIPWIRKYVKDKDVLDLGCVRHSLTETEKDEWLHGIILNDANSVLGVDYLASEVSELQKRGFNIVCDNVETMQLDKKFELIVAGDLIEHLNNFGLFLERVRTHLLPDGVFILTTPNPINIMRFFNVLFRGTAGANPEHTCWFTKRVLLQLADRYDLEPIEVDYVDDTYQYYQHSKFWWPFLGINFLLCHVRHAFAETLCVAFRIKQ